MSSPSGSFAMVTLVVALLGLISCSHASAIEPTREYQNCKYLDSDDGEEIKLYWTVNNVTNTLHVGLWGQTEGWMAIGFNDAGNMHGDYNGSDILVGWVTPSGPCSNGCMQDYFAYRHKTPTRDDMIDSTEGAIIDLGLADKVDQGSVENAQIFHAAQSNGVTVVEFSRPLVTGDPFDYEINPSKEVQVIYSQNRWNDPVYPDGIRLPKHHITGSIPITFNEASECVKPVQGSTHEYKSPDGNFYLSWRLIDYEKEIEFTMIGKTNGWLGIGLNEDTRPSMPGSDMYIGWVSQAGSHQIITDRKAGGRVEPTLDTENGGNNDAIIHHGEETEGYTQIVFTRPLITGDKEDIEIKDKTINLLWAIGKEDGDDISLSISQHSHKGSVQINLISGEIDHTFDELRRVHGALMTFGFCVLLASSAYIAAFTDVKSGRHGLGMGKKWIYFHIILNSLALALIASAFGIIVHVGGWEKLFLSSHSILGFITLLFVFTVQPLLGFIAHALFKWRSSDVGITTPQETDTILLGWLRNTMSFHALHRYVGRSSLVLSLITIHLGLSLYGDAPSYYFHTYYAFISLFVSAFLLKHSLILIDKRNGGHDAEYAGVSIADQTESSMSIADEDQVGVTGGTGERGGKEWNNHVRAIGIQSKGEKEPPSLSPIKKHAPQLIALVGIGCAIGLASLLLHHPGSGTSDLTASSLITSCDDGCEEWVNTFKNHSVAVDTTTYICRNWYLPTDKPYHMTRFEPIVDDPSIVHHITLFAWPEGVDMEDKPWDCKSPHPDSIIVYFWGVGMDPFEYPSEAGYRVGLNSDIRLVMQVHYDNPLQLTNVIDSSGVRVRITSNLRKYDASTLRLGVPLPLITIPTGESDFEGPRGVCSSLSTSQFQIPDEIDHITVLFFGFHMHQIGSRAITTHYRNNKLLGTVGEEKGYLFDNQKMYPFFTKVYKGDELYTTCFYDSRKRNNVTQ